jgi:hypothetical protein
MLLARSQLLYRQEHPMQGKVHIDEEWRGGRKHINASAYFGEFTNDIYVAIIAILFRLACGGV